MGNGPATVQISTTESGCAGILELFYQELIWCSCTPHSLFEQPLFFENVDS